MDGAKGLLPLCVLLLTAILDTSATDHHTQLLCHAHCHCLDTFFQCTSLPPTLPKWVHKLNISHVEGPLQLEHLLLLSDLDTLHLDGNNLTLLPGPNTLPPTLRHLSLQKNFLAALHVAAIPPTLLQLDLRGNLVNALHNNLSAAINLTSLNLGSNFIDTLDPTAFRHLDVLSELLLPRNKLRVLAKGLFEPLTNLEKLDLSRNKLEFLDSIQFQGLRRLKELNLRRNNLATLADGAFYGLDRIHALLLDHNALRSVEKRWLYGLKSLRVLSLTNNELVALEDAAWEHSDALTTLDLSANQLQRLGKHAFDGLFALLTLSLAQNQLSHLEEGLFVPLNALQILDLASNQLSWPLEDAQHTFLGLHQCRNLNLANNLVRSLHPHVLVPLPSLRHLNLSANPLTWLPQTPLSHLLPKLDLALADVHTLVCDCNLAWLQATLLQQTRHLARTRHQKHKHAPSTSSPNSVLCAHPTTLAGTPLVDVDVDLRCSSDLLPPAFAQHPRSQVFLLEGTGRLECAVEARGNETADVEWRKNHEELPAHVDGGVQTSRSLGPSPRLTSILELRNVSWGDGGRYQCLARSALGIAYSEAANVTIHSAPSFLKRPNNVSVRLGSNAKLECAATGFPAPEIGFQKDGGEDFPAALDRRFHVMPNDDSFFIMEAKLADMGTYACSASNSAGTVRAFANVVVYETPSFVARMHDESALEGSHAILECLASGSPRPLVAWSKDGVPLTLADDTKFHVAENGSFLVIRNVVAGDAGRYECLLTNAVGTARGTSTLTVHAAPARSSLDSAAMTVTFIIIAVFCVVGTSAAWVVVIYRTRQRATKQPPNPNRPETTPLTKFLEEATPQIQPQPSVTLALEELPGGSHSSSSSSKDSGTGEEPLELDNKHVLTTFGTHVRTASPLRLAASSPQTSTPTPSWRPAAVGCGLVEEPSVVVLVKKGGDKLLIREAMRVGIPLPPEPTPDLKPREREFEKSDEGEGELGCTSTAV